MVCSPPLDEDLLVLVEGLAGYLVYAFGGVIPVDGVCGYVVGASLRAAFLTFLRALRSSSFALRALGGILATTGGYAQRHSQPEQQQNRQQYTFERSWSASHKLLH